MTFMEETVKSKSGGVVVSILLGLGLATIFQRVCKDNCVIFKAPASAHVTEKVWVNEETCYKYTPKTVECEGKANIVQASKDVRV